MRPKAPADSPSPDLFRNRIALSFEAQGEGKLNDDVTATIVELVALP